MKKIKLFALLVLIPLFIMAQSPVKLGDTMANFTLKSYDGKTISLNDFKGKNIMLIFPRGKVGDHWCQICHYQFAEFADIEKTENFRKKYNRQDKTFPEIRIYELASLPRADALKNND